MGARSTEMNRTVLMLTAKSQGYYHKIAGLTGAERK